MRHELYPPEGIRNDGRRWNEHRQFEARLNTHANSGDGSAEVVMGSTKVVCIVSGPKEPESKAQVHADRASVAVKLTVSPFSTFERRAYARTDRRLAEVERVVQATFEEVAMVHLHPRTHIGIQLHVLAQDGGFVAACINATTLALIDAGIAMPEYVSACSAALYGTSPLLDPNTMEEQALPALTVAVVGQSERVVSLLSESKLPFDQLEPLLSVSIAGCHSVRGLMDQEVRRHGQERVSKAMSN